MTAKGARLPLRLPATFSVVVHLAIGLSCVTVFADDGDAAAREGERLQAVILRFPEDRRVSPALVPVTLYFPGAVPRETRETRRVLPRELRQRSAALPQPGETPALAMPHAVRQRSSRDVGDAIDGLLNLEPAPGDAAAGDTAPDTIFGESEGWLARDVSALSRQRRRVRERLDAADTWNRRLDDPFVLEFEDVSAREIRPRSDYELPQLPGTLDGVGTLPGFADPLSDF